MAKILGCISSLEIAAKVKWGVHRDPASGFHLESPVSQVRECGPLSKNMLLNNALPTDSAEVTYIDLTMSQLSCLFSFLGLQLEIPAF